ncbi:unnamed protein product [Arctogadus glacialis]
MARHVESLYKPKGPGRGKKNLTLYLRDPAALVSETLTSARQRGKRVRPPDFQDATQSGPIQLRHSLDPSARSLLYCLAPEKDYYFNSIYYNMPAVVVLTGDLGQAKEIYSPPAPKDTGGGPPEPAGAPCAFASQA